MRNLSFSEKTLPKHRKFLIMYPFSEQNIVMYYNIEDSIAILGNL